MRLTSSIITLVLSIGLLARPDVALAQPNDDGATLEPVIGALHDSLREAQDNNVKGFPPLKTPTVSLETLTSKGVGAKFNFLVFTIGTKYESTTASTLTFQMTPPTTTDVAGLASVDPEKVKLALPRAINLAKAGVIAANDPSWAASSRSCPASSASKRATLSSSSSIEGELPATPLFNHAQMSLEVQKPKP